MIEKLAAIGCLGLILLVVVLGFTTCSLVSDKQQREARSVSHHYYDPSYDYYQKSNSDHKIPYGKSGENRMTPDSVREHAHGSSSSN